MPDVLVLGLGGMGSAAAHHLAARGARVLGLEQFTPAHDRGSSHGGTRVIRQSYFEDPAYVPLLRRAYELWNDLAAASGDDVIVRTGGLMLGRPASRTVAGSLASAREHGLPHELLDAAEVRQRFPTFAPADDEVALHEAAAGYVRPEATVAAQLRLASGLGADLRFDTPALRWNATGDGVRVETADGVHAGDHLVISAGAWAPRLLAGLGLPLVVERQVQHWFDPVGGVAPYADNPVYVWEDGEGVQIYGFPATDGRDGGVKVAFFRRGRPTEPDELDRGVTPDEVDEVAAHVRRHLPTLPGRHLRSVACMYTTTPDEHFVIAAHPAHDRVTVACGFSGHGFKFVPVVGEVLADLALDGRTDHPVALFDPGRFTAVGAVS